MTWHLVTTDHPPQVGGLATWAGGIARALLAAGEPVRVHTRDRALEGRSPADFPYPLTPMWGRSWRRWSPLWARLSVAPRLKDGDRVLAATWPLALWLLGRAELSVSFHGSDLTRPPPLSGRERVLDAARLLPVSAYLGGLLGRRWTRLPMPIDPVEPVRRGPRLLTIARLVPGKGVDRVLRLGHRRGWPVTVVGDGPERPRLEALAKELGGDIQFTGRLAPEAIPWHGSRAVALFSEADPDGGGAEGLGITLLEAAARGLPTLGSRCGGVPEAAMIVLDPEDDSAVTGRLPDVDEAQHWLRARHGSQRAVDVLRGGEPPTPNGYESDP